MKIAIADTGRMGTAIALRLLEKSNDVTVWNRTIEKTKTAADAGARGAAAIAALAREAETIISILTSAPAMDAVYTGDNGLLSTDVRGKLFIEMNTVRGSDHRVLARKVEPNGALLLECPVSGTAKPAREGALVGFAGGTSQAAASFDIDFMRKDLHDHAAGCAGARHRLAVAAQTLDCFDEASRRGAGKIDGTQNPAWWIARPQNGACLTIGHANLPQ